MQKRSSSTPIKTKAIAILLGLTLTACAAPVSLKIISSDPLKKSTLKVQESPEDCIARGRLHYRVSINPKDFTGFVTTRNAIVKDEGGYTKDDAIYSAYFRNGKLENDSLVFIASAHKATDYQPTVRAVCSIKDAKGIRLVSTGEVLIAAPNTRSPFKD